MFGKENGYLWLCSFGRYRMKSKLKEKQGLWNEIYSTAEHMHIHIHIHIHMQLLLPYALGLG